MQFKEGQGVFKKKVGSYLAEEGEQGVPNYGKNTCKVAKVWKNMVFQGGWAGGGA